MEWTRDGPQEAGFEGFQRFAELGQAGAQALPGVYVILRPSQAVPQFRPASGAGQFKGRDPSVAVADLKRAWVDGASVLYIGKASGGQGGKRGLRKRLDEYRRHGQGKLAGHWGGRYIWQLSDSASLLVAWKPTPGEDPEVVESIFISDFKTTYGSRPLRTARSERRWPK
jgi:hypothetical protein